MSKYREAVAMIIARSPRKDGKLEELHDELCKLHRRDPEAVPIVAELLASGQFGLHRSAVVELIGRIDAMNKRESNSQGGPHSRPTHKKQSVGLDETP